MIKPKREISKVFIHCTAYANQDLVGNNLVEEVRKWHLARGFSDVGYHFLIDKEGTLLEGRGIERIPAAQKGYNIGSVAICLDGLYVHQFNYDQFVTLKKWASEIVTMYEGQITFHGHCEVSNKTCPVFDYIDELSLNEDGYFLGGPVCVQVDHSVLSLTSVGSEVKYLQSQLEIFVDGIFGQQTYVAVVDFQRKHGLEVDGIVGPMTWNVFLNGR